MNIGTLFFSRVNPNKDKYMKQTLKNPIKEKYTTINNFYVERLSHIQISYKETPKIHKVQDDHPRINTKWKHNQSYSSNERRQYGKMDRTLRVVLNPVDGCESSDATFKQRRISWKPSERALDLGDTNVHRHVPSNAYRFTAKHGRRVVAMQGA